MNLRNKTVAQKKLYDKIYIEIQKITKGGTKVTVGIETISAYAVAGFIVLVLINLMLKSAKRMSVILINVILGGALFIILNILGMELTVNALTIGIVGLLGIPGVILVVIMKLILGVW